MRRRGRVLSGAVLFVFTLTAGCDTPRSPVGPTPPPVSVPSPTAPQPPAATNHIQGMVTDTAFRPLSGARVEVLTGPHAGRTTLTATDGSFTFTQAFNESTQLRAVKDGFVSTVQTLSALCSACRYYFVSFYLAVPAPSVNIAGEYTLTIIADAACTALPSDLRTRVYDVSVTPQSVPNIPDHTTFLARLTSIQPVAYYDRFPIGVVENFLTFELRGHGPYVLEQVGDNAYLGFDGLAGAIADAEPLPTVTTSFDGWIGICGLVTGSSGTAYPDCGRTRQECVSRNHQLIFKKR